MGKKKKKKKKNLQYMPKRRNTFDSQFLPLLPFARVEIPGPRPLDNLIGVI